jgi:hypothetical protein
VCEDGYHFLEASNTCELCSGDSSAWFDYSFLACLCLLLALFMAFYRVKHQFEREKLANLDEYVTYMLVVWGYFSKENHETDKMRRFVKVRSMRRHLQTRLKMYITLFQIIAALPFVLQLNISAGFNSIASSLSLLNVGISNSAVVACTFGSDFDFVDILLIQTTYPIVILVLLLIGSRVHLVMMQQKQPPLLPPNHGSSSCGEGDNTSDEIGGDDDASDCDRKSSSENNTILSNYIFAGLTFSNLILPFTSTVIFSTFYCENVDPESTASGDDSFMIADYSVSCQSDRYYFAKMWAILMIFGE